MNRFRIALFIAVALYLVPMSALAWRQGNQEFLLYAGAMVLMILAVYALDRRVRFTHATLIALALWGLAHMCGGLVPIHTPSGPAVLYAWRPIDALPRYDQVVHAYGFFVATIASAECVRAAVAHDKPLRVGAGLAIGFALMGMGLGSVNEIIEFVAVLTLPKTGVGGYTNTGWDLVSNAAGALGGAALLRLRGSVPGGAGPDSAARRSTRSRRCAPRRRAGTRTCRSSR